MASKYVDTTAIMQVIGTVFNNPQILEYTDKYTIIDEDFADEFHRIAFGAIYKIHELGADKITLENISDFLSSRPKSAAIFKQQKGEEWLLKVSETCLPEAFDYYYNRLKKFTLLRAYDSCGIDVTDIYDANNKPGLNGGGDARDTEFTFCNNIFCTSSFCHQIFILVCQQNKINVFY